MANRNHAVGVPQHSQPVCRLVSLLPQDSARGPSEFQLQMRKIAAGTAMVTLLGFACMGVVFTVKHRQARPESHSSTEIAAVENANQPVTNLPTARPKPKVVAPLVVSPPLPAPPVVPVVEPVPVEVGPEELAIEPRSIEPTPAARSGPEPVVVNDRARPAANGEPTREPEVPVATIPDLPKEKPVVQGPKKLPDTEPAIDSRLETFGTRIGFHRNLNEAIEAAKKDKDKLVMVVHYAGLFENGSFAADAVEQFRSGCLLNEEVASIVKQNFICSATKVGASRNIDGRNTGSVAAYFCLSNGAVLHAIPGPVSAEAFLREVDWMLEMRKTATEEYQKDPSRYSVVFKKAHAERYFELTRSEFNVPLLQNFRIEPRFIPGIGWTFVNVPVVQPQQSNKLPSKCPADVAPEAKVHWLFAWQPLPQLTDIYRRVYTEFLKENTSP